MTLLRTKEFLLASLLFGKEFFWNLKEVILKQESF